MTTIQNAPPATQTQALGAAQQAPAAGNANALSGALNKDDVAKTAALSAPGAAAVSSPAATLASALSKTGGVSEILFQLGQLFRELEAAQAKAAVLDINAQAASLRGQAETIKETAQKAYTMSMVSAGVQMAGGAISVAGGIKASSSMAKATSELANAGDDAAKISAIATRTKTAVDAASVLNQTAQGAGGTANSLGKIFDGQGARDSQFGQATVKEMEAQQSALQAEQQMAQTAKEAFDRMVEKNQQMAKDIMAETAQAMRTVARNI